jgi:general secretion pathway protein G
VIALVAILGLLAASGWSGYQDRIKTQTAVEEITAIALVIDDYVADTGATPSSLADVGRGGQRDPWGNAYAYVDLSTAMGKGKARKDHSLVPLNSDYDLYSKGPDGKSSSPLTAESSRDDILRANNGRFVGPASSY